MNTKPTTSDDSLLEARLRAYFSERKNAAVADRAVLESMVISKTVVHASPYAKYFSFSHTTIRFASVLTTLIVVIGVAQVFKKTAQVVPEGTVAVPALAVIEEPISAAEVESLSLESGNDEIDISLAEDEFADEALYI